MRDHDPWVFGMLWEGEYRDELQRLATARLARQPVALQAPGSPESGGRPGPSLLRHLVTARSCGIWSWRRRPSREAEGGA